MTRIRPGSLDFFLTVPGSSAPPGQPFSLRFEGMYISVETRIPFPLPLVYTTYRDRLQELVPYMPNVRHIETNSRELLDGRLRCKNVWHGGGEIPVAARAIINESMLSWTDLSTWNDQDYTTEWQIQTHAFTEAVICRGKNWFVGMGEETLVRNRGELTIDPHQIHGVPGFLAQIIGRTVEEFLGGKIGPNLKQMGDGVRRYLQDTQAAPGPS